MNYIKLTTNLPLTNHYNMQTESKEKSVYNPICPVKAQSKDKSKIENQKKKSKKRIRVKTP